MKERIWFIVNPISGGRKKASLPALIVAHLDHNRFDYEIIETEFKGHAITIAEKAVAQGIDIVCAVGGDGPVHEVGTTLIGSQTQLAIIPLGSGNGLARHMKIPLKIKEAIEIIQYNQPNHEVFDIHDMKRFKSDERIKDLLRNAKAIGCFYVESPAMRMLLTKLQVDDYLGLVAASSVIRPGVSQSGMMREFILRHRFPEKRKNAHPVMLEIMPETYGVMVYQEDVIKVAHYLAGLSLAEADYLRRGMTWKFKKRNEFNQYIKSFWNLVGLKAFQKRRYKTYGIK